MIILWICTGHSGRVHGQFSASRNPNAFALSLEFLFALCKRTYGGWSRSFFFKFIAILFGRSFDRAWHGSKLYNIHDETVRNPRVCPPFGVTQNSFPGPAGTSVPVFVRTRGRTRHSETRLSLCSDRALAKRAVGESSTVHVKTLKCLRFSPKNQTVF